MQGIEALRTAGKRASSNELFSVRLTGAQWYAVLKLLEDAAVGAHTYVELRPLVLFAEEFRAQLEAQRF